MREIVEAARKRLKENPADAGAVLKLADALAGSGRKTEAVRLLNQYGPIVQSRGRLEDAIAIFKKAAQLDPNCELTSSTYLSHLQLKKILEAEKRPAQAAAPPALSGLHPPGPTPCPATFTRPGPDRLLPRAALSRAGSGGGSAAQRVVPAARAGPARTLGVEPEEGGRPRRDGRYPPAAGHPPGPDRPRPPADQPGHSRPGRGPVPRGERGEFRLLRGSGDAGRHGAKRPRHGGPPSDGEGRRVDRRGLVPHRSAPLRDRDGPRAVEPPRARPQRHHAHRPQAPPARGRAEPALRGARAHARPSPARASSAS